MDWRIVTDYLKRSPQVLKLADALGRSRGRVRPLGGFFRPRPSPQMDLQRLSDSRFGLAVGWIGHATCLIRLGSSIFLTDPVFASRVGLGLGPVRLGPKRLVAPALSIDQLPPLAGILITHAHLDHLDRPSLYRLARHMPDVPLVIAHQTRDLVDDLGFTAIHELRVGESIELGGNRIAATEVNHWGARTFLDTHRGYNGFLLSNPSHRAYFAPDCAAPDDTLAARLRSLAPVDVAIVGIGAYQPYVQAHATPEQAAVIAELVGARRIAAIHHSTFRLSAEPMHEPLARMKAATTKLALEHIGDVFVA